MKINEEDTNKLKSYLSSFVSISLDFQGEHFQLKQEELLSPEGFLREILRYAEFYERTYPDRKFRRYIREETHYHLEKQAWMWRGGTYANNFEDCKFTKDDKEMSEAEYKLERDKVLMAFTLSYIKSVKKGHMPPAGFVGLEDTLKSLEQLNN